MSIKTVKIIEGVVKRDFYGTYDDCGPGLYLDGAHIEDIFHEYGGKTIKVTIEEVNT